MDTRRMITDTKASSAVRRLNVNLPDSVYEELSMMASKSGRTLTEIIRVALGLAKVALDEENAGNRLFIGTPQGKILRQIVLPK